MKGFYSGFVRSLVILTLSVASLNSSAYASPWSVDGRACDRYYQQFQDCFAQYEQLHHDYGVLEQCLNEITLSFACRRLFLHQLFEYILVSPAWSSDDSAENLDDRPDH